MTLPDEFKFLGKVRFWAMTMANLSAVLLDPGFPNQTWYISLAKFIGLEGAFFTAVQTVDRNWGDKKVEASKIDAGFTPEEAAKKVDTTP